MSQERLDRILVARGLAASRSRAQDLIISGKVLVGGGVVQHPAKLVSGYEEIVLTEEDIPWVSRAALKLIAALDYFSIQVKGKIALDVGSSTGGFTQVLLVRGAEKVYAIDVGTHQMHHSLLGDPRMILREGTHIKDVVPDDFEISPSLVAVDVSFISLTHVIPVLRKCVATKADIILLIKPQFEVGKNHIGKGVVRDPALHESVCTHIKEVSEKEGFCVIGIIPSPIEGGDGNKEFLAYIKKEK